MSTATMDAPPAAKPKNLFSLHFQQMAFQTHIWEGKRQSKAVEATMAGKKIEGKHATSPRVSLIPDEEPYGLLATRIRNAREGIYAVLRAFTVSCDSKGARLVPVRALPQFVAAWDKAVVEFDATADAVAAAHGTIVEYNRAFWLPFLDHDEDAYAKHIGSLIPGPNKLRALFSVSHMLCDPDGKASGFEDAAVVEFFAEAKANAAKHQQEMIQALVQEPVEKLAAALSNLRTQLNEGKVITPGSFTAVNEAVALCIACSDVVDPGVLAKVKAIAGSIDAVVGKAAHTKENGGSYTQAIRPYKTTLTAAIDGVVEACQATEPQAAMIAKYGAMTRSISFDSDFDIEPEEED